LARLACFTSHGASGAPQQHLPHFSRTFGAPYYTAPAGQRSIVFELAASTRTWKALQLASQAARATTSLLSRHPRILSPGLLAPLIVIPIALRADPWLKQKKWGSYSCAQLLQTTPVRPSPGLVPSPPCADQHALEVRHQGHYPGASRHPGLLTLLLWSVVRVAANRRGVCWHLWPRLLHRRPWTSDLRCLHQHLPPYTAFAAPAPHIWTLSWDPTVPLIVVTHTLSESCPWGGLAMRRRRRRQVAASPAWWPTPTQRPSVKPAACCAKIINANINTCNNNVEDRSLSAAVPAAGDGARLQPTTDTRTLSWGLAAPLIVSHTTLRSVVQGMWLESGACARRRGRRRQLLGGSGAEEQEQEQQEEGVRSRGSSVRPGTPGGVTLANRRAGFSRYACFSDSISLCSTSAWHLVIHDHCPQFWALLPVAQACTKLFTVRTILAETQEALKRVWSCRGSSLGTLVQHDSGDQSGFGWGLLGLGRTLRSNSIDTLSTSAWCPVIILPRGMIQTCQHGPQFWALSKATQACINLFQDGTSVPHGWATLSRVWLWGVGGSVKRGKPVCV